MSVQYDVDRAASTSSSSLLSFFTECSSDDLNTRLHITLQAPQHSQRHWKDFSLWMFMLQSLLWQLQHPHPHTLFIFLHNMSLNHNDPNREISIYALSWKCCCFCHECSCQHESGVTEHILLHVGQKQISTVYIISKQCLLLDQPPRRVSLYQEALLQKLTTESSGGETDRGMWPLYFHCAN